MKEKGIPQTISVDRLFELSEETFKALAPIIDKYRKNGSGFAEIIFGLSQAIKDAIVLVCKTNVPLLNVDPVTELVKLWISNHVDEEKYWDEIIDQYVKNIYKESN